MRPTVISRLATELAERRSRWRGDWLSVLFVAAVFLLIALGVFMSVAVSAHAVRGGDIRSSVIHALLLSRGKDGHPDRSTRGETFRFGAGGGVSGGAYIQRPLPSVLTNQ